MKKIVGVMLLGYALLNTLPARAQSFAESALLFSRTNPGGSARIQALGGSQVSLGGDYSSAYSNPAGLGMYNRSEFTFTPGVTSTRTASDYLGTTTAASQSKFIVPGISFVYHTDKNNGILIGGTFGVSVNRINDFNRTMSYSGVNTKNSIMDDFVSYANYTAKSQNLTEAQLFLQNGYLVNDPTGLAWQNYLIVAAPPGNYNYAPDSVFSKGTLQYFGNPTQHETVQTKGSQYQVTVSYGVNLADKVFLGGGLGFTTLDYTQRNNYTETFPGDSVLHSLNLTEDRHISGSGINLTLGAIVKPIDFFQFGFSASTPTWYVLSDSYSAGMQTQWNHFPYSNFNSEPQGVATTDPTLLPLTYALNTPWRLSGGMTFFIQKHGFITGDVEYMSYGSSRYSSQTDGFDMSSDNDDIKAMYKSLFNYRVGAEYRWKDYRVRAGYSYMPDQYKAIQYGTSNSIQSFSAGLGYRTTKYFVDLTWILRQGSTNYIPYNIQPDTPLVTSRNSVTNVMVTVGFPF